MHLSHSCACPLPALHVDSLNRRLHKSCANINTTDLVIEYAWPANQEDLDTATKFAGAQVCDSPGTRHRMTRLWARERGHARARPCYLGIGSAHCLHQRPRMDWHAGCCWLNASLLALLATHTLHAHTSTDRDPVQLCRKLHGLGW
jgi:hypothetical protein